MSKSIRITFWIMIITIISKILGFFRETLIASNFGASMESDAFFIAYMIPGLFVAAITAVIGTTFIPIYNRMSIEKRSYFVNNLLNVTGSLIILFTIIAYISTPYLVKLFAYGFIGEKYHLTVTLTRILLLTMFFYAINAIFVAKLQSHEKFLIPASMGIPFNLTLILFLMIYGTSYGIEGYTWIVVTAVAIQTVYLIPSLIKIGWSYKFNFNLKEKGLVQILKLSGPVVLGVSVSQLNYIIDRMLASSLVEGSVSYLNYANRVNQLSYGIIVIALITVLYPKLSKLAAENQIEQLKKQTLNAIKVLIIILFPIIFGGIILASPIIKLLFERGAFDSTATSMTSIAFIYYSLGLLGLGIRELLSRVYYSLQDTKTPMKNGIIALALNIILNLILVRFMQHAGLALASSISFVIASILLFQGLRKKFGTIADKDLWLTLGKGILASIIMSAVVYKFYHAIPQIGDKSLLFQLFWLISSISIGIVVYFIISIALKQSLLLDFIKYFKSRYKTN